MSLLNAIVVGANGAVGRGLVTVLAQDPLIGKVTAILRREIDVKNTYRLVNEENLKKISAINIDHANPDSEVFKGHDIGFTTLGLYTKNAKSEESWREIELDTNVRLASLMKEGGTKRFCYLSGAGATNKNPERNRQMFVRVKGETELALAEIGFDTFVAARSGFILGRAEVGVAPAYPYFEWMLEWMKYTSFGMSAVQLAASMVETTICEKKPPVFLEPPQLKGYMREYYQRLEGRKSLTTVDD